MFVGIGVFRSERLGGIEPMKGMTAVQFLLAGIGAVALFSASWYFARTVFGDPFRIWRRQIFWMILGTVSALVIAKVPGKLIRNSVPYLVWAALILNLFTYIPGLGYSSGGARRWIEIFGMTFQPSELTRVALVLYLARMLEKNEGRLENFRDGLLPPLLVVSALILTVYFQNDFSTAVYLLFISFGMFFAAGVSRAAVSIAGVTAVLTAAATLLLKPYRLERVKSWFHPSADPSGAGYQLLKARSALENGGLWGLGLGRGEVKMGGLPAAHSDFVIAVVGEETGFIGVSIILLLFTVFAVKGWQAAGKASDTFSRWGLFGLISAVYWQVLINFSVVSGLLPATGIPLPLFSAGGSAAFITLIIFGLIYNLSEAGK
ncbi:MAG: putative lipid II flippase FtsW [Spirochaetes bacterium]|nr:MAG: putative lipid II flippase FtsW [Spirochaetota bacterium]